MAKRKDLHRQRVEKVSMEGDKVSRVLKEFKNGKLRTKDGKQVVHKEQALAMALSQAGISTKDLEKTELKNKLLQVRKELEVKIEKEILNDKALRSEIVRFFIKNPQPTDDQMHALAEQLKIEPPELETLVYGILSDIISRGYPNGQAQEVDLKELAKGIKVEMEHTDDPAVAEAIARTHLQEDPEYYSKNPGI